MASRLPETESELKRMRAYENLMVVVIVIAAVLICGGAFVYALTSSLGAVAHSLTPGP